MAADSWQLPNIQELLSGLLVISAFFGPSFLSLDTRLVSDSVTTKFAAPTGFYAPENSPTVSRKHDSWLMAADSWQPAAEYSCKSKSHNGHF
jgi:hypothetical protein